MFLQFLETKNLKEQKREDIYIRVKKVTEKMIKLVLL